MSRWQQISTCCMGALLLMLPRPGHASPDSLSTLAWRAEVEAPSARPHTLRIGLDLHSNLSVRAVPVFHRPGEDLGAQKLALVPELRAWLHSDIELEWSTALAIQDRTGTRAELPHSDASQQLRIHYRALDTASWQAWAGAGLMASFQGDGSLRYELSATLARRHPWLDVEAQLLHHQAAWGESAAQFALAYGHLQISHRHHGERGLLLPLLRASVELSETGYEGQQPVAALSAQLLASYRLDSLPARLMASLGTWYRADLEEWTVNLSLGFQSTLGGKAEAGESRGSSVTSGVATPQGGPSK